MKRLMLSVFLVFFLLMPVIGKTQTYSCVEKQKCPEGQKPPACCKEPQCEFYEQFRMKRAVRNLFANKKVRKALKKKAGGDNKQAAKLFNDFVMDKAKHMDKYLKCEWKEIQPPPGFDTNSNCQITAMLDSGPEPMGRDTALKKFNTCSEFINAAYDHEQFHKDICFKKSSVERENEGIETYAQEEMDAYQKELDALKADAQQYWNFCGSNASRATKRKLAKMGVDVLKKKASKKKA